ncbi:putative uncharacterized protein DDB_G0271606, partial [Apis dorsata]|uniref:putative uncharacterized protein DDB_G0271606 n=1 Tax=Apis dorsata TaxID=7462 RepID=UPI0012930D09
LQIRIVFLLATVSITLTRSQDPEFSSTNLNVTQPPIKLDKNLRRALLKALTDLEAESAEQYKDESETISQRDTSAFESIAKKNLNDNLGVQKTTFSFKSFPSDDDVPNEDKLQNSSFVEGIRYVTLNIPSMNIEKATQEDARSFHVQNMILPEEKSNFRSESKEQREKTTPTTMNIFSVNKMESLTQKPDVSESLARSASNGIANALVDPKPTVVTPTVSSKNNVTITELDDSKDKTEEVKIFQAPLVAAFTVQQDEQGVPKSVVPIFRSPNDGQALTLQEQLEFKQQLLEKQLAELQQQQFQQTQFLVRQQQLYEQQLRQKQQQQYYLQEQVRIKQLEEQTKLKQLEEQKLKQLEEQRLNRFQLPPVPQKQFFFDQSNNFLTFQPLAESNVHLQPSLTLEVPNVAAPPTFQPIFQQDLLRLQPFRQQQQSQYLHQQQQIQPQQLQQLHQSQQHQRLQQSFGSFSTDFQPSVSTRYNRQEAFNLVGNFGFNGDNKIAANRGNFGFVPSHRTPTNFYNPYAQFKQSKPPTPARQIQHLLYQSGIAGDPNNVQGIGNPEDLNIVSKVLALNVGAVPNKNLQFATNSDSRSLGKNSA